MPRMLHTFYIAIGYAFGTSTMNCRMSSSPCHCNCGTTSWSAHHVHHRMQRSCAHGWKVLCWAGQKWVELPRICRDTVGITPAALWAKGQREKKHTFFTDGGWERVSKGWFAADPKHPSQPSQRDSDVIFCRNMFTKDPAKRLGGGPSDGEEVARCVLWHLCLVLFGGCALGLYSELAWRVILVSVYTTFVQIDPVWIGLKYTWVASLLLKRRTSWA